MGDVPVASGAQAGERGRRQAVLTGQHGGWKRENLREGEVPPSGELLDASECALADPRQLAQHQQRQYGWAVHQWLDIKV